MPIDIPRGTQPTSPRMAVALSELQWRTATTKERRAGHWIPIDSREWRRLIGSRYHDTLRDAERLTYIDINGRYSTGRFAKSYRLAAAYRTPLTQRYDDACLPSRIRLADDDRVGHFLASRFAAVRLPDDCKVCGWDSFCARQIRSGGHYATRCQYGRFHSTFTGLRREARATLTCARSGERLVELDVANCQPLILGCLAKNQPQQTNTTHTQPTNHNPHPTHHIPYVAHDILNYLDYCERGELYDELVQLCHGLTLWDCIPPSRRHRFGHDRPLRRSDIKRQFLIMLFADVETTRRMAIYDVVGATWPSIADFILQAKAVEYQDLARQCQRAESAIMVDGVCSRLMQTQARVPLITIHDGIGTTAVYVEQVVDAIAAEFARFGIQPMIRTKLRD